MDQSAGTCHRDVVGLLCAVAVFVGCCRCCLHVVAVVGLRDGSVLHSVPEADVVPGAEADSAEDGAGAGLAPGVEVG